MKIAMVYDAVFPFVKGGGERRYYEIARRLAARHDMHLVSWQYWDGPSRMMLDGITYRGTGRPPALYGRDGRRRITEALSFGACVLPLLLRERYDVIDCASVPFLPLFSTRLGSQVRRARMVATWFEYWDDYWPEYLGGMSGRAARAVERAAAGLGDAQIAISRTTAERMAGRRRASRPVHVIEPGVDVDAIAAAPAPPKTYDVTFAARLNAQKNADLLLDALAHAARTGTPLTCVIAGDGPERPRLEARARELGLGASVRFAGRIEEDAGFWSTLKSARIFAWPSAAEGFGIAPLEAMACGLPVVMAASQFSATHELLDGGAGVVAPPEPAAFADAMLALLRDELSLAAMRDAALARARRSSWDAVAAQVEAVYEGIIAAR